MLWIVIFYFLFDLDDDGVAEAPGLDKGARLLPHLQCGSVFPFSLNFWRFFIYAALGLLLFIKERAPSRTMGQ